MSSNRFPNVFSPESGKDPEKNPAEGKRRQQTAMITRIGFCALAGFVASGGLLLGGLAFAQSAAADRLQTITSYLRSGEFDQALRLLDEELRKGPQNAQLWALDGIALSGKGKGKDALIAFRRALAVSPNYLPALEGAAQVEYETGDREAVPHLQRVLKLAPGDSTAHAMLGSVAYKSGNCIEAVSQFEQSGTQLESQSAALREYGTCLAEIRSYEKAIAVFQKLTAAPGNDPHDVQQLAAIQIAADKPGDAIQTLHAVLQDQPNPQTLALAAEAYEAQKDTPHAVELLHQAIVKDPKNVDFYVQFADLALVHQSFQVGIDMVDAGLKTLPEAAPLYLARGVLYVQLADYDHAEADFEKAEQLDPHLGASGVARGMLAEQQDDPDKALAVVRAKLKQRPHDAQLLYVLADTIVQKNPDVNSREFNEAVAAACQATTLQPGMVTARDTLAKLYLQQGKIQPAIDESRASLRYDPGDQVALYHLIVGLRKAGKTAELPELSKQLAQLRMKATQEEGEHNRYKLVEQSGSRK
jgi:tetratricopeptide (TPR) repeat protein